jgi:hypothetical protein
MKQEEVSQVIQKWLMDEGFGVRQVSNPLCVFNFEVEDGQGRSVTVAQLADKPDQIQLGVNVQLSPGEAARVDALESSKRDELLWNLRFALINLGVGFQNVDVPLEKVTVETVIYYDGLTKHEFMHRLLLVRRALVLFIWILNRQFREPARSIGFRLPS